MANLESTSWSSIGLSLRTVYKNPGTGTQERNAINTLMHALANNDKRASQDPVSTDAVAHASLALQKLRAAMPDMVWKEAKCWNLHRRKAPITSAGKEVLSITFQMGFKLVSGGIKNSSHVLTEHVLAKIAHNRASNAFFDRDFEQWQQSPMFMAAFTGRALATFRFVRPMQQFARENMNELFKVVVQGRNSPGFPFPFSKADSSFKKLPEDDKHRIHVKNKHIKRVELDYPLVGLKERKGCRQQRKKLPWSLGSPLRVTTATPP